MASLPRWPRQSLGSFWSPRTAPKEASTIYSEKFRVDISIKQIRKVSIPKTFWTLSSDVRCHFLRLYCWHPYDSFWWCHREISRSIQIVSLVILTAAMCVSPAISAYLPGDNVMTTEGWCHCHPMCAPVSWWPCDHVTSVPGPWHSTAHSRLCSPLAARSQSGRRALAAWSPAQAPTLAG